MDDANEKSLAKYASRQQQKRNVLPSSFTNYKLPKTPEPTCLVIMAPVVKRTEQLVSDDDMPDSVPRQQNSPVRGVRNGVPSAG